MIRSLTLISALALCACTPQSDDAGAPLPQGAYQLVPDQSQVSFVSVKAGDVGEAHSFEKLDGSVDAKGAVKVAIDLASAQTGIDVRNQRLRDMLFEAASFPSATLSAQIDIATVKDMKPGERKAITLPVNLDLHGTMNSIEAKLTVTRLAGDAILVETATPIIVDATAVGLGAGIEKLRTVAKLPAISAAVPVTASLVFRPKA